MATNPSGIEGALYDPNATNQLGGVVTLIGFEGDPTDGTVTEPDGQDGDIWRIGHLVTEDPGVVGFGS